MVTVTLTPGEVDSLIEWLPAKVNPLSNDSSRRWLLNRMTPRKGDFVKQWLLVVAVTIAVTSEDGRPLPAGGVHWLPPKQECNSTPFRRLSFPPLCYLLAAQKEARPVCNAFSMLQNIYQLCYFYFRMESIRYNLLTVLWNLKDFYRSEVYVVHFVHFSLLIIW